MPLWAGRFEKELDRKVNDFNSSLRVDSRMVNEDIRGSIAHVTMLGEQGIIPAEDSKVIAAELAKMLDEIEAGTLILPPDAEDVHTCVEAILTQRLGDTGKRLHTARSRNDQVALDVRLYLKGRVDNTVSLCLKLLTVIRGLAVQHTETVMSGYTHLQRAQPVSFAHHLLAWAAMVKRDVGRLLDAQERMDVSPLGAGALASTTYPINRARVAELLGLSGVTENSMDSVADRDFAVEICSALSILMMHLSRFSEEIILWTSAEFGYIELDDAFATGSSIMPQKKNPDIAELVRGKTGRVYGDLVTLLTMMKGLPLAYNKDMQEDKEAVFDALDTADICLDVFADMLATVTVRADRMAAGAQGGYITATDCADYLVKKGMPFRDAYKMVGGLVAACIREQETLATLPLESYKKVCPLFEEDVYVALDPLTCLKGRSPVGGPAPEAVAQQIELLDKFIAAYSK